MPKQSEKFTQAKREEIIRSCEQLYQTKSFKEITIKDIAAATSFSRPSIYNYFQTKEEIFLALLKQEYESWTTELESILNSNYFLTRGQFARKIAQSLAQREQFLKLMTMNHFDMESNSRPEQLRDFKAAYGKSMHTVELCLNKYFPEMTDKERKDFVYMFFPFIFGIYPYTVVTEKQRLALEQANVNYVFMTIYEITYSFLKNLLNIE